MSSPPSALNLSFSPPPMKTSLPMIGSLPSGSKLSPGAPSDVPLSIQSSPSLPISCSSALVPRMKSLPWPPKDFVGVLAGDDEVVAEAADDQVDAVAAVDDVVAVAALDVVVAAEVGDDVVAGAAAELSLPSPPSRRSLPPSPQSVSSPMLEMMMSLPVGAAEHDVVVTGVVQIVGVGAGGVRDCRGSPAA